MHLGHAVGEPVPRRLVLKGGQIDVQVAVLPSATNNETLAVTGGTGVYAGVTGWARSDDTGDRTFHLIRPGQG